jgi:hypothetical protein
VTRRTSAQQGDVGSFVPGTQSDIATGCRVVIAGVLFNRSFYHIRPTFSAWELGDGRRGWRQLPGTARELQEVTRDRSHGPSAALRSLRSRLPRTYPVLGWAAVHPRYDVRVQRLRRGVRDRLQRSAAWPPQDEARTGAHAKPATMAYTGRPSAKFRTPARWRPRWPGWRPT